MMTVAPRALTAGEIRLRIAEALALEKRSGRPPVSGQESASGLRVEQLVLQRRDHACRHKDEVALRRALTRAEKEIDSLRQILIEQSTVEVEVKVLRENLRKKEIELEQRLRETKEGESLLTQENFKTIVAQREEAQDLKRRIGELEQQVAATSQLLLESKVREKEILEALEAARRVPDEQAAPLTPASRKSLPVGGFHRIDGVGDQAAPEDTPDGKVEDKNLEQTVPISKYTNILALLDQTKAELEAACDELSCLRERGTELGEEVSHLQHALHRANTEKGVAEEAAVEASRARDELAELLRRGTAQQSAHEHCGMASHLDTPNEKQITGLLDSQCAERSQTPPARTRIVESSLEYQGGTGEDHEKSALRRENEELRQQLSKRNQWEQNSRGQSPCSEMRRSSKQTLSNRPLRSMIDRIQIGVSQESLLGDASKAGEVAAFLAEKSEESERLHRETEAQLQIAMQEKAFLSAQVAESETKLLAASKTLEALQNELLALKEAQTQAGTPKVSSESGPQYASGEAGSTLAEIDPLQDEGSHQAEVTPPDAQEKAAEKEEAPCEFLQSEEVVANQELIASMSRLEAENAALISENKRIKELMHLLEQKSDKYSEKQSSPILAAEETAAPLALTGDIAEAALIQSQLGDIGLLLSSPAYLAELEADAEVAELRESIQKLRVEHSRLKQQEFLLSAYPVADEPEPQESPSMTEIGGQSAFSETGQSELGQRRERGSSLREASRSGVGLATLGFSRPELIEIDALSENVSTRNESVI